MLCLPEPWRYRGCIAPTILKADTYIPPTSQGIKTCHLGCLFSLENWAYHVRDLHERKPLGCAERVCFGDSTAKGFSPFLLLFLNTLQCLCCCLYARLGNQPKLTTLQLRSDHPLDATEGPVSSPQNYPAALPTRG